MVAVLFARHDSVYKTLDAVDVYDENRDALTYKNKYPVVCHPPCRAWGRLRAFAKPKKSEKELARWAVKKVRELGGVLEHPETSKLWEDMNLPLGPERDQFGGFTISVDQFWWGHRARKRTWLYICGIEPKNIPNIPLSFDLITHTVSTTMKRGRKHFKPKPSISKSERQHTPIEFAKWLIELAQNTSTS